MDLVQVFWTGIIMIAVAWIATAIFDVNIVAALSFWGVACFVVPMLVITYGGVLEMHSVSSNLTAMNDIANKTTVSLTDYFGNHIGEYIVSDIAGTIFGVFAKMFFSKK